MKHLQGRFLFWVKKHYIGNVRLQTGSTTERNAGQPSFNIMHMRNDKKGLIEISDSERFLVTKGAAWFESEFGQCL